MGNSKRNFKLGAAMILVVLLMFGAICLVRALKEDPHKQSFELQVSEDNLRLKIKHRLINGWDGYIYLIVADKFNEQLMIGSPLDVEGYLNLADQDDFHWSWSEDRPRLLLVCTSEPVFSQEGLDALYNQGAGPNAVWLFEVGEEFSLTCD